MIEKKTIKPMLLDKKEKDTSLRNKNNLKFFMERSSETVEKTLNIAQKLQYEINLLKECLTKVDNALYNSKELSQEKPKQTENKKSKTES